jgi:branched-chain amino acid transport system substrate-binding protein
MSSSKPIRIGYVDDLSARGAGGYARLIQIGIQEQIEQGRLHRPVELVHRPVTGLPSGSASSVVRAFEEVAANGVVAMLGPSITDNVLAVRATADRLRMPTLAWPGGEECRTEHLFQYQAGSLEDEPQVIARYLVSNKLHTVTLVHDLAATGMRMAANFEAAAAAFGIRIASRVGVSQLNEPLPDSVFEEIGTAGASALVHLGLFGIRPLSEGLVARRIDLPVISNIVASMAQNDPDWLEALERWVYIDMVSDGNLRLQALRPRLFSGHPNGPSLVSGLDIGHLLAEALVQAPSTDPEGIKAGFERVKYLPSAAGREGTRMGFGVWDRAALKGDYLVLRQYVDGISVELPNTAI